MEIQGFVYDEKKKRYFRLTPDSKLNDCVKKKISLQNAVHERKQIQPAKRKPLFIPDAVSFRESRLMSCYSNYSLQECVLHARLSALKKQKEVDVELYDFRGNEMKHATCEYMIGKPENDLLVATWRNKDGYILERICVTEIVDEGVSQFGQRDKQLVNAFPPANKVVDFEAGGDQNSDYDVIMCLTNHLKPDSTFSSLSIYFETREAERARFIADHNLNFEFHEAFNACAGILPHTFAIGGQNVIRLFKPFGQSNNNLRPSFDDHTSFKVKGIVSSLKFDSNGKTFFAGTNKGKIHRFDVNVKKEIQTLNLKTRSIVYLHPLQNSNQLIASCHENDLLLVDFRMPNRHLLSYSGHVNDCKKIPVSVDEAMGIVCCEGKDSVVRFWSLQSGKLLHSLIPESNANEDCVWFSHSWKCCQRSPKALMFGTASHMSVYF
ncbi:DDB1- and CUL4-associated factor 4-like protein [Leptotrombidium deliense]|uniref:DDB1-and CUL4-associated factor 4-like protein n=1 Tax=Leptotrombidium deliense TaxID=299467 RepID=A0A443SGF6_9ACAR|nr:DDB1- and CUL4-associated factor 4-like protein [Leptotrombidium deliense]